MFIVFLLHTPAPRGLAPNSLKRKDATHPAYLHPLGNSGHEVPNVEAAKPVRALARIDP
jgi:hypothetical protein